MYLLALDSIINGVLVRELSKVSLKFALSVC